MREIVMRLYEYSYGGEKFSFGFGRENWHSEETELIYIKSFTNTIEASKCINTCSVSGTIITFRAFINV